MCAPQPPLLPLSAVHPEPQLFASVRLQVLSSDLLALAECQNCAEKASRSISNSQGELLAGMTVNPIIPATAAIGG